MGNNHINQRYFPPLLKDFPVFEHEWLVWAECPLLVVFRETDVTDFDLLKSIFTPPQISVIAPLMPLFYFCSLYYRPIPNATGCLKTAGACT